MAFTNHLRRFAKAVEELPIEKQIAVALWLEGVVAGQKLDQEERQSIVKGVNHFVGNLKENEYDKGINALLEYLRRIISGHKPTIET